MIKLSGSDKMHMSNQGNWLIGVLMAFFIASCEKSPNQEIPNSYPQPILQKQEQQYQEPYRPQEPVKVEERKAEVELEKKKYEGRKYKKEKWKKWIR